MERDSTQRLWRVPFDGSAEQVLFPETRPVRYFAPPTDSTWVLFVLGTPVTLHSDAKGTGRTEVVVRNITSRDWP